MEKYLKTKAIVLKRSNYKEADKIVTLYTEEKGKITAIAKSIRKLSSTKRGHLELFNLVEIQATDHKGWYILTQAEAVDIYQNIKHSFLLTTYGYYVCEIFEKLVPEFEPNETLFRILNKTLAYIDKSQGLTLVNAFNLKLLKLLGFYSKTENRNLSMNLQKYLFELESNTYEEIADKTFNQSLEKQTHEFLRNLTEDVLERGIKTRIINGGTPQDL